MRIVVALSSFAHPGGTEADALVVAEQLQRLGHDVAIRSGDLGAMAEEAARRGVVAGDDVPLPDVVLAHDAPSAYELADAWPAVPQVFRAGSDVHDFQLPPALPGVAVCAVALSERFAARLRALAAPPGIVRLRHPVDVRRFIPRRPLAARPRRALLLSNYLGGPRLEALTTAWEAAGVECVRVGWPDTTLRPEDAIDAADIVVGKARVTLEAMACGRAAYVYDFAGRDGWVTPERYPAMEADNFAGHATDAGLDPDAIAADLAGYDAAMGEANRDLILRHHHAAKHAEQLVAVLRRAAGDGVGATPDAAVELARMHRRQRAAEGEAELLRAELGRRGAAMDALEERFAPARAELEALYADREIVRADRDALAERVAAAEARVAAAEEEARRLRAALGTRRAQLGIRAGRAADRLRGRP